MAFNGEPSEPGNELDLTTSCDTMHQRNVHNSYAENRKPKIDPRDALLLTDPLVERETFKKEKGENSFVTFEWIRENETYRDWLKGHGRCMWISGGPGTRKTMLSIFLTEELQTKLSQGITLLFFFCINGSNANSVLRGLSYQLLNNHPKLSTRVSSFFDSPRQTETTLSSPHILWTMLKTLLDAPEVGEVFCVLDRLDKCDDESITILVNQFHDLYSQPWETRPATRRFNLMIVSRNINGLDIYPQVQINHGSSNYGNDNENTLAKTALDQSMLGHNLTSTQSSVTAPSTPFWSTNEPSQIPPTSTALQYYPPLSLDKLVLKLDGRLNTMASNWSDEEWANKRRIVMFQRSQHDSTLEVSFRAVPIDKRPINSTCISCIWWHEKSDTYVTYFDILSLAEMLLAFPKRMSAEEKNRMCRDLEGFHPYTIDMAKPDTENFFKLIMGFPLPKPRNNDSNFKVAPWSALEPALKKIISNHSRLSTPSGYTMGFMSPVSTSTSHT